MTTSRIDAQNLAATGAWEAIQQLADDDRVDISPDGADGWIVSAPGVPDVEVSVATPGDRYTGTAAALIFVHGGQPGTWSRRDMRDRLGQLVSREDKVRELADDIRTRLGL